MQGFWFWVFCVFVMIAGTWLLISGIIGLAGKTLPFKGSDTYTKESLSKMARIMSIPSILGAGVCMFSAYKAFQSGSDVDGTISLFAICVIVLILILQAIVMGKVAKKR